MDESSEIKSTPLEDFDIRYSSICQKKDSKGLAAIVNRRSKLMEAARIREDEVWNRLQPSCVEEPFVFPVNHHCYKNYVFKKTIEKIMILIFVS